MRKKAVIAFITLFTLSIILICVANIYVNDNSISINDLAIKDDRVLFVFAHPDDELTAAGTLSKLNAQGIPTGLICLTRGEAGKTGGLVTKEKLGEERTKELKDVQSILGIDYLKIFDFPDSGIKDIEPKQIKQAILEEIRAFKPTVIVGYDTTVGFYGHDDHRLAGLYLQEVLDSSNVDGLNGYFKVTLPEPMIDLALKMSPTFKNRYPQDPAKGLPKANFAVKTSRYGKFKRKAMEAHKTQKQVIDNVAPYCMSVPPFIYFKIFDREYFHKVELGN